MDILLLFGGVALLAFVLRGKSPKQRAKESYEGALALLSEHPESSNLRRAALERGRAYHKLAKTKDPEMAIKNDIDSRLA